MSRKKSNRTVVSLGYHPIAISGPGSHPPVYVYRNKETGNIDLISRRPTEFSHGGYIGPVTSEVARRESFANFRWTVEVVSGLGAVRAYEEQANQVETGVITIFESDRFRGEYLDDPVPRGAVALVHTYDGLGGHVTDAYMPDAADRVPESDYPIYPPCDAEGWVGGRGWAGSPWGTKVKWLVDRPMPMPGLGPHRGQPARVGRRKTAISKRSNDNDTSRISQGPHP